MAGSDQVSDLSQSHQISESRLEHAGDTEKPASRLALSADDDKETDDGADHSSDWALVWPRIRAVMKEPFSEFLGTFFFLLLGCGSVAQFTLSKGAFGSAEGVWWGWGIGLMIGVYIARPSGSHLNPSVTFTMCVLRRFPWRKFPIYTLAQTLGGFAASGVVYANYIDAINVYEGGPGIRTVPGFSTHATGGIFCTYPQPFMSRGSMFFSEFAASAVLLLAVFALLDATTTPGAPTAGPLTPLCFFFALVGVGCTWGWETGYAINFARDFGPRLMSYFIGYGSEVWSAGDYYFWIPMVAPLFGGVFGAGLYDVFVYTGASPINRPWFGVGDVGPRMRRKKIECVV